jgi:hypothetical protein
MVDRFGEFPVGEALWNDKKRRTQNAERGTQNVERET